MAINIQQEQLIAFRELARALPRRRKGRPLHVSTVHRWRSRGLNGVRLEAVRVGGQWNTSWEAFRRFCDRLTALHSGHGLEPTQPGPPRGFHEPSDATLRQNGW